jgi:hypothetical protein
VGQSAKALGAEFRKSVDSAFQLLRLVQPLQRRATGRAGAEAMAERAGKSMSEATRATAAISGRIAAPEALARAFDGAKRAFRALELTGRRYLSAAAIVVAPKRKETLKKAVATFGRRIQRAQDALVKMVAATAPEAPAEAE